MKVIVPRKMLLRFRKECRQAWPKEHLACLWGTRTPEAIVIAQFKDIPFIGTEGAAEYHTRDVMKSKMAALRAGMEWLGTIHSHPFLRHAACCEHLSKSDIHTGLAHGEAISGVVLVYDSGKKTEVHFYQPSPILSVIYA